ncbi:AAA family ATPase [Elusimicrobiota bacterium]
MNRIEINEQFKIALELMKDTSDSVFITGKAGTGKSTLLDYFRNITRKQVAVLAPTGVAAVNIKGQTIHSFFHFKPNITTQQAVKIAARLIKQDKADLYRNLDAIIIDEVSMVRPDLMDCVDIFLRTIRRSRTLPFGGLQVILIGDLYQLPPVVRSEERKALRNIYEGEYFFNAHVFKELKFAFLELEKVYRQKDPEFIRLLNTVRNNSITHGDIRIFNKRFDPDFEPAESFYIYLTARNDKAAVVNAKRLDALPGKAHVFEGVVAGEFKMNSLPAEITLELKKGAQVMLLNNDSRDRWINGTIGVVRDFGEDIVEVELEDGETVEVAPFMWEMFHYDFDKENKALSTEIVGTFTQFPIRLAWAITIHKSQGKTFERVIIDVGSGTFATGQMYVALSRARTLEGVTLKRELKKNHVRIDYRIMKFLTQYQYEISDGKTPLAQKIGQLEAAVRDKRELAITYLKANDEKSRRIIKPVSVGEMEYAGKTFTGLKAFCHTRKQDRTFRVDRILEMKPLKK